MGEKQIYFGLGRLEGDGQIACLVLPEASGQPGKTFFVQALYPLLAGLRKLILSYLSTILCNQRVNSQSNHIFASIVSVFKMECMKIKTRPNHSALRSKLYLKAVRSAFDEIQKLKTA